MKDFINRFRELAKKLAASLGAAAGVAAAALALATPTPAFAQSAHSISLLSDGILSLTVSNGIPYTNLNSPTSLGTNLVGLSWTNSYGSNIVCDGTNFIRTKLTHAADLWADATGYCPTNANLSLTFVCGSGNNGTTNYIDFVPLYDGTNESTETGDLFRWIFTSSGTTVQTIHTNSPLPRWPGAQRFRAREILDGTNASASQLTILQLKLNAFPR